MVSSFASDPVASPESHGLSASPREDSAQVRTTQETGRQVCIDSLAIADPRTRSECNARCRSDMQDVRGEVVDEVAMRMPNRARAGPADPGCVYGQTSARL